MNKQREAAVNGVELRRTSPSPTSPAATAAAPGSDGNGSARRDCGASSAAPAAPTGRTRRQQAAADRPHRLGHLRRLGQPARRAVRVHRRQRLAAAPEVGDDPDRHRRRRGREAVASTTRSVLESHPLNGARVKNTTHKHLLQGPVTVLEAGSYAGDARIDDLPAGPAAPAQLRHRPERRRGPHRAEERRHHPDRQDRQGRAGADAQAGERADLRDPEQGRHRQDADRRAPAAGRTGSWWSRRRPRRPPTALYRFKTRVDAAQDGASSPSRPRT